MQSSQYQHLASAVSKELHCAIFVVLFCRYFFLAAQDVESLDEPTGFHPRGITLKDQHDTPNSRFSRLAKHRVLCRLGVAGDDSFGTTMENCL